MILRNPNQLSIFVSIIIFSVTGLVTLDVYAQNNETETPVKIERYIDFQCPPCRKHFFMMEDLKEEYGDKIQVISLHFPLKGHPYAPIAARASEAARNQGKYDEMATLLYKYQSKWAVPDARNKLIEYANQLELDTEKFKRDLVETGIYKKVANEKTEGSFRGVYATPTIFIEGEKIDLPNNKDELREIINRYLEGKMKQ